METKKPNLLAGLLPKGTAQKLANEASVSVQYVRRALREGKPSNRFVQQALKIAKECGSLEAAQTLASIAG
jgi:hypothetical protein